MYEMMEKVQKSNGKSVPRLCRTKAYNAKLGMYFLNIFQLHV